MLHTKVAIEELGRGKKRLQHNIVDLSSGIATPDTDEAFTADECKHTHTRAPNERGSEKI